MCVRAYVRRQKVNFHSRYCQPTDRPEHDLTVRSVRSSSWSRLARTCVAWASAAAPASSRRRSSSSARSDGYASTSKFAWMLPPCRHTQWATYLATSSDSSRVLRFVSTSSSVLGTSSSVGCGAEAEAAACTTIFKIILIYRLTIQKFVSHYKVERMKMRKKHKITMLGFSLVFCENYSYIMLHNFRFLICFLSNSCH